MTQSSSRREFLRQSAGLSILGAGAPLALQLAAAGSASAQTATDYKALICIFLAGGQDSNNMVLATDSDSWSRYLAARAVNNVAGTGIALKNDGSPLPPRPSNGKRATPADLGGVLPITPRTPQPIPPGTNASTRTFALHPMLAPALPLFTDNKLAILANVGMLIQPTSKDQYRARQNIPPQLFSHNDQQSAWQSGATEGAQTGWGGRIADIVAGVNADKAVFTGISAKGNAVYLAGDQISQYVVDVAGSAPGVTIKGLSGSMFGSSTAKTALNNIIRNTSTSSNFANDYADVVVRGIGAASTINSGVAGIPFTIPAPPTHNNVYDGAVTPNPLVTQLHMVLKLIAAGPRLGIKRQVFFVQLDNFDTHREQNFNEPDNLAKLAEALAYLDTSLRNMGGVDMRPNVTAFTASDFSRTFAYNGSGTDHAWGGHHFIYGGAVNGGDMYGQYPTIGIDRPGFYNPDMDESNMIPTKSVDQYGATLARWLGVPDSEMPRVFPRIVNFNQRYLGFI